MFGNVLVNTQKLNQEEKNIYNQVYCGLCRSLGELSGPLSRLTLNYDMTFLAIFLSSLYEPSQDLINKKCLIHPKKSQSYLKNDCIDYAADMCVSLAYYKCIDDWNDDKNIVMYSFSTLIKTKIKAIKEKYPKKMIKIEELLKKLSSIEKRNGSADDSSDCFGKILGEVFKYKDDIWAEMLYNFGYAFGKFIYLTDAAIDMEKDKKFQSYNPFLTDNIQKNDIENILKVIIGEAAEIFERLPIVENTDILRNIIYSGVWIKYNMKKAKAERKNLNGYRSI